MAEPRLLALPSELKIEIVELVDEPKNAALSCQNLLDIVKEVQPGRITCLTQLDIPPPKAAKLRHLEILPLLTATTAQQVADSIKTMPQLETVRVYMEVDAFPVILPVLSSTVRLHLKLHMTSLPAEAPVEELLAPEFGEFFETALGIHRTLRSIIECDRLQAIRVIDTKHQHPEHSWGARFVTQLFESPPSNLRSIILEMNYLEELESINDSPDGSRLEEVRLIKAERPHERYPEEIDLSLLAVLMAWAPDNSLVRTHVQVDGMLSNRFMDFTISVQDSYPRYQSFETAIGGRMDGQQFIEILKRMPRLQKLGLRVAQELSQPLPWDMLPSTLTELRLTSHLVNICQTTITDIQRLEQIRTACPLIKKLSIIILRSSKECLQELGKWSLSELDVRLVVTAPLLQKGTDRDTLEKACQLTALDEDLAREIFGIVFSHAKPCQLTVEIICDLARSQSMEDSYFSLLETLAVLGCAHRLSTNPDWEGICLARLTPRTLPRGNAEHCRKTWSAPTAEQIRSLLNEIWGDHWPRPGQAPEVDSILSWEREWRSLSWNEVQELVMAIGDLPPQ